ncbi:MAG: ribosome biogenesis GTPase YlqF [Eubacteriales bacterium]|nr:ribosome biogenesis GTPase YlqF [Eubacteriales bacterium]
MPDIQWFPGHMAKTLRELKESIKLCDLVVEVCDARIVRSSRNPELQEIIAGKQKILVLNKQDLADPQVSQAWLQYFADRGETALAIDARQAKAAKNLQKLAKDLSADILARAKARGRISRPLRILVAGIPNCGKSTLINSLIGKSRAQTANKPGVTRQLQWWKLGSDLQLLDSPGLLWPKLESRAAQIALGSTGAVRDEIMARQELAGELLYLLSKLYPAQMAANYGLKADRYQGKSQFEINTQILSQLAEDLGFLRQGGEMDLDRAADHALRQFRQARLGRFSLEQPQL